MKKKAKNNPWLVIRENKSAAILVENARKTKCSSICEPHLRTLAGHKSKIKYLDAMNKSYSIAKSVFSKTMNQSAAENLIWSAFHVL